MIACGYTTRPPPDDSCAFGFTLLHTAPATMSAVDLLLAAVPAGALDVISVVPAVQRDRGDLLLAEREIVHRDGSGREACSRSCIARRGRICVLLTLDFWSDDRERVSPVWDEALRSIELGRYVLDPTVGDVEQN